VNCNQWKCICPVANKISFQAGQITWHFLFGICEKSYFKQSINWSFCSRISWRQSWNRGCTLLWNVCDQLQGVTTANATVAVFEHVALLNIRYKYLLSSRHILFFHRVINTNLIELLSVHSCVSFYTDSYTTACRLLFHLIASVGTTIGILLYAEQRVCLDMGNQYRFLGASLPVCLSLHYSVLKVKTAAAASQESLLHASFFKGRVDVCIICPARTLWCETLKMDTGRNGGTAVSVLQGVPKCLEVVWQNLD
jgi:hypothetical protein